MTLRSEYYRACFGWLWTERRLQHHDAQPRVRQESGNHGSSRQGFQLYRSRAHLYSRRSGAKLDAMLIHALAGPAPARFLLPLLLLCLWTPREEASVQAEECAARVADAVNLRLQAVSDRLDRSTVTTPTLAIIAAICLIDTVATIRQRSHT